MLDDDKPQADVADQLRPVHTADSDLDDEPAETSGSVPEADPADVADQRRSVPTSSGEEPWR
ncbi:hypothetical protein DMH03_41755 [Amycolatopsis sp. WAC 01376]|uniref:hypothetical protein n=1 Tax=Amycolatopsis sp. WAC 01376 TaxID=2203195 RepID=UPI000F776936|nr:hypothetical protein [Amycolatopsis sp. WAC 01376]RSM51870.1 hypothetical protein DMH03_41755 [Amycolatopsis sp. WAC 01376]